MELSHLSPARTDDPNLRSTLGRIDDQTGETWLHLLGLCVDIGEPRTLDRLIGHIESLSPLEFRLILLGMTAWSWRSIVGGETIEAAARGDVVAQRRLLEDDRYYGRHSKAALASVLPMSPEETRSVFVEALAALGQSGKVSPTADQLAGAAERARSLADSEGFIDAVELLTGYRYVPEPEARRVVAMPHLASDGLSLVQHHDARLIVYGARPPAEAETLVVETGKALADPSRVRLLACLRQGRTQLGELVAATGLTRSTVHHHLRVLRSARLVTVSGNSHAYHYEISKTGRHDAIRAITGLLGADAAKGDSEQ